MEEITLRALANKEIDNKALAGKDLPKRIKVLNWGRNETTDGPVFLNKKTLSVFADYQKKTGRDKDVALDFDHCTVPGSKEYVAGQPKSIAAYGNPELIENDGLYLNDLEWTDMGEENARNYKDLSPTAMTDKQGSVLGLHSVALTPNGAVDGLKFYSANETDMIKKLNVDSKVKSEYNKDGANAGLDIKDLAINDKEALKEIEDLEEHEEDEIEHALTCNCAECSSYSGAGEDWNDKEDAAHENKVNEYSADDHKSIYGDVEYADKENHKYPIDTEKHVRAAWSYINMPKNAGKYDKNKLSTIKGHIKTAAKKFGIEISENKETKTKTMNANTPDAYKAIPQQYKNMNDTIIKKMAAIAGIEGETDAEKVLFAFLAKYEGVVSEHREQITKKSNTEDGGLKQFAAKFEALENEVKTLKEKNIPMSSNMRVLSVDSTKKITKDEAIAKFNSMLNNK